MDILDAITQRKATRAYLDKAVDSHIIEEILLAARWAPSGVNSQPWQVAVVSGDTKQQIGDTIIQAREQGQAENPDYAYYPQQWNEPYKSRRKQCGLALYQALGIAREESDKQKAAWYRNYHFFHAPVGLLFFIDQQLAQGSWVDMGMFIQNVMLAARHFGLETCPQAALAEYPDIVRGILAIPADSLLVCGMAVGYADYQHPINSYQLEREPLENFTRWYS